MGFFDIFKPKQAKSPEQKKAEIISIYKAQMVEILEKYGNNPNNLQTKKVEFLKKVNNELACNIYFSKDDLKLVLGELLAVGRT